MKWTKVDPIPGGNEDVWRCGGETCGALVREKDEGREKHDRNFHTAKRGHRFRHLSIIDPNFTPGEGERYVDGPKAVMKVTSVTQFAVYFTYASDTGTKGQWHLTRGIFMDRYGDALFEPGEAVRR